MRRTEPLTPTFVRTLIVILIPILIFTAKGLHPESHRVVAITKPFHWTVTYAFVQTNPTDHSHMTVLMSWDSEYQHNTISPTPTYTVTFTLPLFPSSISLKPFPLRH